MAAKTVSSIKRNDSLLVELHTYGRGKWGISISRTDAHFGRGVWFGTSERAARAVYDFIISLDAEMLGQLMLFPPVTNDGSEAADGNR